RQNQRQPAEAESGQLRCGARQGAAPVVGASIAIAGSDIAAVGIGVGLASRILVDVGNTVIVVVRIAGIAQTIAVGVFLAGIAGSGAVVRSVRHSVTIAIAIAIAIAEVVRLAEAGLAAAREVVLLRAGGGAAVPVDQIVVIAGFGDD